MANHLAQANSPYLLQHAENPVEWYPWGEEALAKAMAEDKPIFLSIGYAACHWCHVMAHESFEDPETAAIMNGSFINIKVDREERPDLDNIYMSAVVGMTGSGGWPMSVFITPSGEPFYGGTYFPPTSRYNIPAFVEVLQTIARLWKEDRDRLLSSSHKISEYLRNSQAISGNENPLNPENLDKAAFLLAQNYEWKNGGWGQAPKFPQPMAIEFMVRRAARGDQLALDIVTHALKAMAKGGMYDVIGGGFSRYSTDDHWLIPHFEKMLYDNALLARVYLYAFMLTGDPFYRAVCERTLDFIQREMTIRWEGGTAEETGFYSSLDADSEGEEGKFYLWTSEEIRQVFKDAQLEFRTSTNIDRFEFFRTAYGISETGNFEGHLVLQRVIENQDLAERFNIPIEEVERLIEELQSKLLSIRQMRIRPGTDDKSLTAWNALALVTYAEAARYLKRQDYLQIAQSNAEFLLNELYMGGRLFRSWRQGQAQFNGFLEDYAGLILGLIALYQSDPQIRWYAHAIDLTNEMNMHFEDPEDGFFDTRDDHEQLILRPKDLQDNAIPSGNALAAMALLQMAVYTGNQQWRTQAEKMLQKMQSMAMKHPTAFAQWLCVLDFCTHPVQEIAILGEKDDPQRNALLVALWENYRPQSMVAISNYPPGTESPPLLFEKPLLDGNSTAYICQNFVCKLPVNRVEDFISQLKEASLPEPKGNEGATHA